MRQPNAEYGRPIAIGLLVLALALVYLIGLHWWWTAPMLSMGERIDDLREQELQMRMHAQQRPEIEKRLAEVRQSEAANPGFLPEATVELAQAGLVQRMESQIAAVSPDHSACTISQRTPTPWAGTPERYQRVVVQVRLLCGMTEFSALLHAFESGRPQLFVANLNIISRRGFTPDNAAADAATAPLDIGFDLYGYLRSGMSTHAP
jgi:general secretion pathway protein M